jgi:hypothetical protein
MTRSKPDPHKDQRAPKESPQAPLTRPFTQHSALSTQHSAKRLRELLRSSPLIAPELRAHWLRVLPHLSAEQRAELGALLEAGALEGGESGPTDAGRP